MNVIAAIAVSIISGLMLYAIFPPLELSFLAWFALVPVLISLTYTRYAQAFFMTFLMGMVLWGLLFKWINAIPGFPIVAFLMLLLYFGMYYGLFGLFYCMAVQRTGCPKIIIAPTIWVTMEYVRSNLSFLSIPLASLGLSQHSNIPIIQIASVTSLYGISFLIVLANAVLTEAILWILNHRTVTVVPRSTNKPVFYSIFFGTLAVISIYLWGNYQVKVHEAALNKLLTISIIQPNISDSEKWNPKFLDKILNQYRELTLQVNRNNPDLIIWPETAVPGYLIDDPKIYMSISTIARESDTPLLFGSSSFSKTTQAGKKIHKFKNSAFLVDKTGKLSVHYDKMRLFPFWEYLPYEGKFPWPKWLVPEYGRETPGSVPTIFKIPEGNFGVIICWENFFPTLVREFVNNGAKFMVNLANEAAFPKTPTMYQTHSMNVFRAVENRVSVVRCANTGISSIIDPLGKVRARVVDKEGNDIMVTGMTTGSVPVPLGKTFYTRHGDIFVITCIIIASLLISSAALPVKIRRLLKISGTQKEQSP